jgi:hypothetical protein
LFFGKRCTSRGEYQQAQSEDYSERVHIVAERLRTAAERSEVGWSDLFGGFIAL